MPPATAMETMDSMLYSAVVVVLEAVRMHRRRAEMRVDGRHVVDCSRERDRGIRVLL